MMSEAAATKPRGKSFWRRGRAFRAPVLACALALICHEVSGADLAPELAGFEPFVGKTWRGLVDPEKEVYDVARWEVALAGKAVRIRHSVADGAYGGETLVMWNAEQEVFVYYYFTTAGFYTHGTMTFADDGTLASRELVTGDAAGVSEVAAAQRVLPDGSLQVETRMMRDGVWEERPTVIYAEAPEAQVILPAGHGGD